MHLGARLLLFVFLLICQEAKCIEIDFDNILACRSQVASDCPRGRNRQSTHSPCDIIVYEIRISKSLKWKLDKHLIGFQTDEMKTRFLQITETILSTCKYNKMNKTYLFQF